MLIYLGHVKPLQTKLSNTIEIMNEFLIDIITFHLLLYTDFVPETTIKFNIGWSNVALISISMFINLNIVCYFSAKYIKLLVIKYFRIARIKAIKAHKCIKKIRWKKKVPIK